MNTQVLVITGAGGIGQAIARRQGPGKHILLADISDTALASAAGALEDLGHRVSIQRVDVSSRESVHALAQAAAELGDVAQVVHTAGVSRCRRRRRRCWRSICSAPHSCWRSSVA